ncbi:hypothetical protein DLE01_12260, partial [Streptomyces sp. FT05W]
MCPRTGSRRARTSPGRASRCRTEWPGLDHHHPVRHPRDDAGQQRPERAPQQQLDGLRLALPDRHGH